MKWPIYAAVCGVCGSQVRSTPAVRASGDDFEALMQLRFMTEVETREAEGDGAAKVVAGDLYGDAFLRSGR